MRITPENTGPCSNRGYILPSLVLVFALILSILAYTNYQQDNQEVSAADESVITIPAPADVDKHEEQIQQLEGWLSRTRGEFESRLDDLEEQLAERTAIPENDLRNTSTGEHNGKELLANLDVWQESVNRQIGRVQDGFEASIESLEARILNTASTGEHVYAYQQQEPAQYEQLEQRLASIDQRLTQVTDTYATRIELMEDSLEYLSASGHAPLYEDKTPTSAVYETQQPLLQDQINQATSKYDARMKALEMRLAEADQSSRRRFEDIEKSLWMTAEHLEALTTTVATATDPENSATVRAANETISAQPPAAVRQKPATSSRNEEPTTGQARKPEAPAQKTIARQDISGQIRPVTANPWSVNLASYTREGMAKKKLEEFKNRGVIAEIFTTKVRGKTMYRLRVTGFDNLETAKSRTPEIKQKLGLNDVWISRN